MKEWNGLGQGLGNIWRVSSAQTRSISAENLSGAKGQGGMAIEGPASHAARDLGQGWKVSPYHRVPPRTTFTLAEIEGPGVIQHIWITCHRKFWRSLVLRFYWDGEDNPSVEVPYGDFFCNGWGELALVSSLPIAANPNGGMNSYWPMPFRQSASIAIENLSDEEAVVYYQISYSLTDVPADAAYLHAQWRRNRPLPYKEVHTLVDRVQGQGHYVGTYVAWGVNSSGWWGEGEIKFFIDGDEEFPTICGTGTEDYFGGAWNFDVQGEYRVFSTPFMGLCQVIKPDGLYRSQQRFGLYRWHVMDPVRFQQDLRVTIQALGWRSGGRYQPLQDDIASTTLWYQVEPHAPHPQLPGRDGLEIL